MAKERDLDADVGSLGAGLLGLYGLFVLGWFFVEPLRSVHGGIVGGNGLAHGQPRARWTTGSIKTRENVRGR